MYNQYTGDPAFCRRTCAMTEAVTSMASTKAAAAKYLTKDAAVVVYCVPGKRCWTTCRAAPPTPMPT
jgi:zinc protease